MICRSCRFWEVSAVSGGLRMMGMKEGEEGMEGTTRDSGVLVLLWGDAAEARGVAIKGEN